MRYLLVLALALVAGVVTPSATRAQAVPEARLKAILAMSRGGLGLVVVLDDEGRTLGIFTDGDLRRTLERKLDFNTTAIVNVMSPNPRCIGPDNLAAEAVQQMEQYNINQMLVVDGDNKLVGALNMHDLLHAKVI